MLLINLENMESHLLVNINTCWRLIDELLLITVVFPFSKLDSVNLPEFAFTNESMKGLVVSGGALWLEVLISN